VEKVQKLRDDIVAPQVSQPVNKSPGLEAKQLELTEVTEEEVLKAIKNLKSKPCSGLDQVNSRVVKDGGDVLAMVVTHIVNTSITTCKFPARWKESKVIPLFKKGDNKDCKNYRPISNLSVVSKVLEMLIHKQMTKYCEDLNIIPDSQHGFQSGKSNMTALISMVDCWEEALEREESVGLC
jgi:predicted transcriptional regulator